MGLTQHVDAVDNDPGDRRIFCCCAATSGGPARVRARCAATATCRATARWASGKRCRTNGSTRLGEEFAFEPPRAHGLDTVESIHAMLDGRSASSSRWAAIFSPPRPTRSARAEALRRCRLTAHVSTKLNRGHLVTGRDGAHPARASVARRSTCRPASRSSSRSRTRWAIVHASRGSLSPAGERLLSETRIVARLARATLPDRPPRIDWESLADDYDRIREHIARVVPDCEGYVEKVRAAAGFRLPNRARERDWETASGKAVFFVHDLPDHRLGTGQLLMMTIRSHDQYNTTVYGLADRYRGVRGGRRVVLMNTDDAGERELREGDVVDITSHFADGQRLARALRGRALRHPARLLRYLLPRGECPRASRCGRTKEQHAREQVGRRHPDGLGGLNPTAPAFRSPTILRTRESRRRASSRGCG